MSADRLAEIKARIEAKLADWPDFFNVRSPLSAAETLRIIEQVEALTAERDALRAVVARVEALADAADDTDGEHSHRPYDGVIWAAWIGLTLSGVAADLRAALATTGEGQ